MLRAVGGRGFAAGRAVEYLQVAGSRSAYGDHCGVGDRSAHVLLAGVLCRSVKAVYLYADLPLRRGDSVSIEGFGVLQKFSAVGADRGGSIVFRSDRILSRQMFPFQSL